MKTQDIYRQPLPQSGEPIKRLKQEWLDINPFLADEKAQELEDNPPIKQPSEPYHDSPL